VFAGSRQSPHLVCLRKTHQKSGSFPPPALPGFDGTMTLSDARGGRCLAAPLRQLPSPCTGLPRLRDPLSRQPAPGLDPGARCPLPRWNGPGASVGCFPRPCWLPRSPGGSASTTSLSRPAQASLALSPVDLLVHPSCPLSQGSDPAGCPTKPRASYRANRPLHGWDLHPQGDRALRGAPEGHGVRGACHVNRHSQAR
jgi:hypothetical protein